MMSEVGSKKVATAAIKMALTTSRQEEAQLKKELIVEDIRAAAVDYGGEFIGSIGRMVERAVVAAKRGCSRTPAVKAGRCHPGAVSQIIGPGAECGGKQALPLQDLWSCLMVWTAAWTGGHWSQQFPD